MALFPPSLGRCFQMTDDPKKFFEYGKISLAGHDSESRQAILLVCLPYCIMQTVTPALLGAGWIDEFRVMSPTVAWIPTVSEDRFKEGYQGPNERMAARANTKIRESVQHALEAFKTMSATLTDPSDLVPMLPLGTYVEFRYRCRIDDLAKVVLVMDAIPVAGVPDLRFAMAAAMAEILQEFETAILD